MRRMDEAGRSLVVLTSVMVSGDGRKLMGTFSMTHVYSLSLIADMAPKPCMNSMRVSLLFIHSAPSIEFISKSMSLLVSVLALMNLISLGMSSRLFFMATSAILALATMVSGVRLSSPWEVIPSALVSRTCLALSPFRATT